MPFFNYFFSLQCVSDRKPSNNPSLTNFKWVRDIQGVSVENPSSQTLTIAPSGVTTVFTGSAKKFLYVESDAQVNLTINGIAGLSIKPIVIGTSTQPGSLLLNSAIASLILTNPSSTDPLDIFVATSE